MPYSLSTAPHALLAQAAPTYAIGRTLKKGHLYHDINFKLSQEPHMRGEAFTMHLPAGTPIDLVISVRDILRKAIENGMITDRAAWNNLVGQLVRAVKALNKCAAATDALSA